MLPRFTKPPLLVNGLAWYPYSDSIQKALTFESKYGDRVELFERSGDRIGVPRGLVSAESSCDQTTEGHPIDINCTVPPRNKEQARLIRESVGLLRHGKNHLLRATTGLGKSFLGINVAAQLNCTTLIVVTKEDLMGEGQWRGAIKKFTDCTDDDIGVIRQDVCDYKGKKFVLGMVHSLVKDKYPDEVKRHFGLVIWDESGSPDTLVTTSLGQVRIQDLVRSKTKCKALSLNTDTGIYEWREILAYHEHPPKNPMMRITHEQGYLDFTSEHPCFTSRGWIKVKDLLGTDFLTLDTEHSFHYNNSKHLENGDGSMGTRNCPRGYFGTNWHDHEQGQIAGSTRGSSNSTGHGEVPTTSALRPHTPKRGGESRLGRPLLILCNLSSGVAATVLASLLLFRRPQNTSAIACNASMAGMAGLVGNGRRFQSSRVPSPVPEQVSKARCGVFPISAFKLWAKEFPEKSQGLLSRVFKRSESNPQAGISPVHNSKHDVQAGWSSLRGQGGPVQGVSVGYSYAGWRAAQERVLPKRDLPKGQKVHELPPRLCSPSRASQNQSNYMGRKVRVLSVVKIDTPKYVYDLEVEGNHNFVANGVLVHNCHRMGAETFSQSCGMFSSKWRLGLSATPKRIDAKDFIFRAHIGPVMVEADLVPLKLKAIMERTKFRLPMVTRRINGNWVSVPLPHDGAKMMGVYKAMAQDQGRNALILDFVYAAWKKGRKIIVFSDLRDAHLEPMYHQCIARGIPAEDMAFYVGGLTEKQRELAKTKQILWATYKMTSEATDIPTLDTAVFATPRANITQPVGRILRSHPDKKQPIVFDPVDTCSSVLQAYASKRRTEYYRLGGEVVTL